MNAALFLGSYRDGVELAHLLMACTTKQQAGAFYSRTMQGYLAANGEAYANAVAQHALALVSGVEAIRQGVEP